MHDFVRKQKSINSKVEAPKIFSIARERLDKLMRDKVEQNQMFGSCRDVLVKFGQQTTDHTFKDIEDPVPLSAYAAILDDIAEGNRRQNRWVVGISPQTGKTTLTLAGLIYIGLKIPGSRSMYVSYSIDRSAKQIKPLFVLMLKSLGFDPIVGSDWVKFGKNAFVGFYGLENITGKSCTALLAMDDLYKSFEEAQSETVRQTIRNTVFADVISRGNPALLCIGTRFSEFDVQSELLCSKLGFRELRIPALCDDIENDPAGRTTIDESIWEKLHPQADLLLLRESESVIFAAMYQNLPGSAGTCYYDHEPKYFSSREEVPEGVVGAGIDVGYSGKGDASVLYVLLRDRYHNIWVKHVHRRVCTLERFADEILDIVPPGCVIRTYGTTMENSAYDVLRKKGLIIDFHVTNRSKAARAQGCYQAWNKGRILYPHSSIQTPMEANSYRLIRQFSGEKNGKDDDNDALVAAFDSLSTPKSTPFIMSDDTRNALRRHHETLGGFSV